MSDKYPDHPYTEDDLDTNQTASDGDNHDVSDEGTDHGNAILVRKGFK